MTNYQVYVISQTGKPLMPTKRFGKVRRLLKSGRAKVIRKKPFTIKLLYETTEYIQPLIMGMDPGTKEIGATVRKENGEIVHVAHLETRNQEVGENMAERGRHRGSRRQHRREKKQRRAKKAKTSFASKEYTIVGMKEKLICKFIKPAAIKFLNRIRKEGWQTPTANHLLQTHQNFVKQIMAILPVEKLWLEYGKFDIHKLQNPQVEGKGYQNGRKKGYANAQEYVLCRDKHICQLCEKGKKDMQVHHVIWESEGGGDVPENLVCLCARCHRKVHKSSKIDKKVRELFAGMRKRYVHTTLLNSIMPRFHQWLDSNEQLSVSVTYGYQTKEKRREFGLPKEHHVDAYLISLPEEQSPAQIDWGNLLIYEYKQFRRHHRQIIHATRDRNYKLGNKIVAKNRRKRLGQLVDSLADLLLKKGEKILSRLRVLPGKKVIRSRFNGFRKGDTVEYRGKNYVVKGYGEMGRRVGFVGQKEYVPAKDCRLVIRNTGIVCL